MGRSSQSKYIHKKIYKKGIEIRIAVNSILNFPSLLLNILYCIEQKSKFRDWLTSSYGIIHTIIIYRANNGDIRVEYVHY